MFELPSDQEESDINAGIAEDPDARELADQEFQQLRPMGRPKAEVTKERITIRLSPDEPRAEAGNLVWIRRCGSTCETTIGKILRG